jgi:hypothetical protein
MKFLIILLLIIGNIFANNFDQNISIDNNITNYEEDKNRLSQAEIDKLPKVIYLSYKKIPKRVLKGEIFTVTIKTLSTVQDFTDVTYELSGSSGLKLLSEYPSRDMDEKYYYETFYYLVEDSSARLPDIEATLLNYNDDQFKTTILEGKTLNVVALNPKDNFSNIIANSFELDAYKTTSYDQNSNILVFTASATNCDIASFKLSSIQKQGAESIIESYFDSKITYYAVIDKDLTTFSFSYFNLNKNRFINIDIPIIVNDDSVTTQSDLKPKDQSHELLKMQIATAIAVFGFIIVLWRRKYVYLIFVLLPLAYVIYIGLPSKEVCIKEGSDIQLLPVTNGTIFETTPRVYHLQKEGEAKDFTKVKLQNNKIGWVRDEDICSN